MKKHVKRAVSIVLAAILCCSVYAVNIQAAPVKGYVKSVTMKTKATIVIPADKKSVTKTFKVVVKGKGTFSKKFTAKSGNPSVAKVMVKGNKLLVTAKKAGKAKIVVTTKGKNKKGKKIKKLLVVTVKKAVKPKQPDPVPEVDKREGVITKKDTRLYYFNAMNPSDPIGFETHPIYFSTAYPDVPFVSDSFAIPYFLENYSYDRNCVPVKNGGSHTYQLPMGTSVIFDYNRKMMWFSDYSSTLKANGDIMAFNPFGPRAPKETQLYRVTEKDRYYGGDPILVTFDYDEVPMLRSGDEILIPLQTYSDLFFSYLGQFFSYNGKDIYVIDNNLANDPSRKEYYDQYCDTEKLDTISSALAQVNYYELCNALDAHYGLQAAHNIETFDGYFERKGIKEKMLSGDLATIEKAQMEIGTLLFEDFHSGAGMQSVFLKEPVENDSMSSVFMNRQYKWKRITDKRTAALGTLGEGFPGYERRDDTVFITFDEFAMEPTMTSYFAEGYEPKENVKDTLEFFAYAMKRLQTKDKDVKNVVIDLACNGGGAVFACGFVMQAVCGQCNINVQNPNTWALHQCVLDYDLNFDGVKDENDKSMLDLGLNVAVNISDSSFSSGNLLPNALDQLDDRILLIGQTSGGGACSVGYLSTAIGSTMQISSEHRFVTMKNGYISDIDGGIRPDVYLTIDRMFDRDYIADVVRQQFATEHE